MRERQSVVVELLRFGVWRAAMLVVGAMAVASMATWGGLALANPTSDSTRIAAFAAALAFASMLLVASLIQVQPGTLACVEDAWTFTFDHDGASRTETGELAVAIDLGSFLLLTLTRTTGPKRLAHRWLPVQRRGLESDWHALRCAVYSPPVAQARASATDSLTE